MLIEIIFTTLSFLFIIHYIYCIFNYFNRGKMQTEDAKFIKKRFKGGNLEPHPNESSIIVNYKLEAALFSKADMSDPMLADKKDCQRIIRLKALNAKTDVTQLAKEVVDKCDLIHKSQLSDVEQIIYFLKNRKLSNGSSNASLRSKSEVRTLDKSFVENEKASIRNIEEYIELLYEELPERIRGAACILQLARNPDNLEELQKNEAVLSALSRVLREDWRKSIDLSTNIIYTFFCFSTYTLFHPVIVQYKIGSLCMDVIEHELKRFDQMKSDLDRRKNPEALNKGIESKGESDGALVNVEKPKEMEPPRRRIPELKQRPKSGNWSSMSTSSSSSSLLKAYSMNNSYHEGLFRELQINVPSETSITSDGTQEEETKRHKDEAEKIYRQFKTFTKKQEQLLRVSFYMLLNLSENTKLEEKMRRKNIIYMLVKVLERQNIDLLILAVTFLKKLSIIKDNKDEMKDLNLVDKLPRLLQNSSNQDLIKITLKLIFNLSFDGQFRSKFIRIGLLPLFVQYMSSDEQHHFMVVKILYHLSIDDKVKNLFAYTECIHLLIDMLLLNLNKDSETDLIALAINLALNKKCAEKMCEQNRLKALVERAFKYNDVLLMKVIRNISTHQELTVEYIHFVDNFAKCLTENDIEEDFKVECVGILGNMNCLSRLLDFAQILQTHCLLPTIKSILTPGQVKDDFILEIIIFLSTCTTNNELCAMLMCKSEIILALIELLKAKQEDDEMVLQIIFMFQQVLKNECTRNYIIKETETPAYLIDLMHDKNQEVRKVCDQCLDIISLTDASWANRIKLEKFRNHNSQWLSMVETESSEFFNDIGEAEEDMPVFLTSDYLTQIYQSGESVTTPSNGSSRPLSKEMEDYDILKNY